MQDLSHLHKEIARLELTGHKPAEIVAALSDLDITPEYVQRIRSNPIYQHYLRRLEDQANTECKDVRKILAHKAVDMLNIVVGIAESEESADSVRLRAAQDVLDRAGYKPVAHEVRLNINESFSSEERQELRRIHDQMRYSGLILDIEPEKLGLAEPATYGELMVQALPVPTQTIEPAADADAAVADAQDWDNDNS